MKRQSYDEAEDAIRRQRQQSSQFFGVGESASVPTIRVDAPVAPGSASSREAAEAVTDPMRMRAHRLVMLALAAAARPLSREEIAERTGYKESGLCGRIDELRPEWVEAVDRACVAKSGKHVDGYRLTEAGRNRMRAAA